MTDKLDTDWNYWAADDWREKGYKTAAEEVQDMAAVGRSFMERYSGLLEVGHVLEGFTPMDDPTEAVTELADTITALRQRVEALEALVQSAFNEGVTQGMDDFRRSKGGYNWSESKAKSALEQTT